MQDIPTDLDWNILTEIENSEEVERLEMGEMFLGRLSSHISFYFTFQFDINI